MSKISTYPSADTPLLLSDRLIGTESFRSGSNITPLATKNFSLGELLQLFSSNFPAASLQAVLNTGNTATQNITLTGNITATLIKPLNIEDNLGSQGTVFQYLSKNVNGVNWVDLPISNLQNVLNTGNTATQNIILTGDITSTLITPTNIKDGLGLIGTSGQVLSKTSTGIKWINNPVVFTAGLNDVLLTGNIATNNITLIGNLTATRVIPGNIQDESGDIGVVGQIIVKTSTGINWVDLSPPGITVADNTGLKKSSIDILSTIYNTTIGDTVNSIAVGGAISQPASVWKNKSLVQVLDTILFPEILASVLTIKSASLNVSNTTSILEIGSVYNRTLTATFIQGTIKNGDGTINTNSLVGSATNYIFTGTGISQTPQIGNTLNLLNIAVVSGSNSWGVLVNHSDGIGNYFSNYGNIGTNLFSNRVAGISTAISSPTITGIYPYYYYKSNSQITPASMKIAIENGTAIKVIDVSTGTISIPYNIASQYIAVAYPSTSTVKTKYYTSVTDNGNITLVFQPVSTLDVNSSNNPLTSIWNNISYKVHVSIYAITNANATIELKNT